jgi:type VI protein secretion system component Hcp
MKHSPPALYLSILSGKIVSKAEIQWGKSDWFIPLPKTCWYLYA